MGSRVCLKGEENVSLQLSQCATAGSQRGLGLGARPDAFQKSVLSEQEGRGQTVLGPGGLWV